jgi:predicted O-methyltransferase YrrM
MNPVLEEISKSGQVRRAEGGRSIPLHSQVSDEEGLFLQDLVRKVDAKVSLEVGLAYGVSALYICDALRVREGTRHITVDPNQHGGVWGDPWEGIGIANLRRAGFGDIVQLIEKPSHLALPELVMAGLEVDFAFIDGWHAFDFTLVDFFYIDRMLRVGGIIAFDDVAWPAVRKVCRFVATNRAYSVVGACGKESWKRRTVGRLLRTAAAKRLLRTRPLSVFCSPQILRSDWELGIRGGCVAFRKEKHDDRRFDHFNEF